MTSLKQKREIDGVQLALLRTELANRRTLLSYIKTALGLAVTGLGLLHFTEAQSIYAWIGALLLVVAVLTVGVGLIDYLRTKAKIQREKLDAEV
ncbi:DUF202 domain-containing protein [uncultured Maricaulis sp.]|uniref:DUF202 domain-containing protein n=1 Tax=uncultured Maricaulis sp. TaxID=174710 RepID=UPI0030D88095|tara:strand:- start:9596 stop:9877 length:282 start_codon:yes stop_codon:yes gene_type:complete